MIPTQWWLLTSQLQLATQEAAEESDDTDNSNFEASASESDDSEVDVVIDHEELAHSLPTKTQPLTASKKRKRKLSHPKKPKPTASENISKSESRPTHKQRVTIEVINDDDAPSQTQTRKCNPVYLFYD
ncbi:hypothetical protein DXG01_003646 [Tephrocybe rancida]|nr:hypothetical protein DXG01_003646 [Tephrocybe rancida]